MRSVWKLGITSTICDQHKQILLMARYRGGVCVGRGQALILNTVDRVAVMLEDCGDTGVRAGNLVNYIVHPEAEPMIVGSPASCRDSPMA